jgi:GMP synthase (glutamine-hydrolysing)
MTMQLSDRRGSAVSAPRGESDPFQDDHAVIDRDRVLVLHHDDGAPIGRLLNALVGRGMQPVVVQVTRDGDLPDPGSVRAAMIVGSDRFDDAEAAGYLHPEIDWARQADRVGTAVMGVGHGARVLAVALGGEVTPADRPIRGWVMVDTSLPHLIPTGPWLTWQHDVVRLPSHGQVLAQNRLGPQAFTLGRHLCVQFHPEATPQTVVDWVSSYDEPLDPRDALDVISRDHRAADSCTRRVFSTFINTIQTPALGARTGR